MEHSKKIYLIDGNAYIHRAYHAIPLLTTSNGMPINAVFGFVRMVFKVLKNFKPEYFCICFDSDKPTFRHEIHKEYKATRKRLDDDLKIQFPIVKEFTTISELPHLIIDGYEADDIIACLTKKFKQDFDIIIISGDKDILQLVEEKVTVYNEHKDIWYDINAVKEKYGVLPTQLVDYFSLVGDKIDNINGIPGVGPKTASQLLNKYGSIDKIYENIYKLDANLKEKFLKNKQQLYVSKQLITLADDIKELSNFSLENIKLNKINIPQIKEFLFKYGLKSILKEIDKLPYYPQNDKEPTLFGLIQPFEEKKEEEEVVYVCETEQLNYISRKLKGSQLISCFVYDPNIKNIVGQIGIINLPNKNIGKFYIPLIRHTKTNNELINPIGKENFVEFLDYIFFEKVNFITYDIKFQLKKLYEIFNINKFYNLENVEDILILSHLVDPNKKINSLQDLANLWLGFVPVAEIILPVGFNVSLFPLEKFVERMFNTMENIYKIYQKLEEKINLVEITGVYKNLELPMVNVLIKMEQNGMLVDKNYLESLKLDIEENIKDTKNKIFETAGNEFNLNSPKQLSFILFEKLKLPPIKKKKTGYSTDEEVLQKLKDAHPIVELILKHRELEKLKNTYIEPILSYINPKTFRIHTTFNLTGTATGRLSSEEPNMQNIPVKTDIGKKIRNIFIVDKGYKLVSLDYSQVELRILAHFSDDENLMKAFFENKDIHKLTAMEVFGLNESQITDELRRVAKVINFGIIYGMRPHGLSKELSIDIKVAEEYISKYFEKYKGVKKWIDETIKFAKKNGYVKTLLGRIRPIPEINSTNKQLVSFAERLAINTPIQGTAADIIKLAMIKIDEYIEKENLQDKVKMLLQIHDELLFEINNDILDDSVKRIKEIMENAVQLKVPLVVDIKISDRWGD